MGQPPPAPHGPPPGTPPPPPPARGPVPPVPVLIAALVAAFLAIGGAVAYVVAAGDGGGPAPVASSGPVDLREPLTFALVEEVSDAPCGAGAVTVAGASSCYRFGPDRLTVRRLEQVRANPPDPAAGRSGWTVTIVLNRADASGFTALTGKAAQAYAEQRPGRLMGMLLGETLISEPAEVMAPISGGEMQISGPADEGAGGGRAGAESLVRRLAGR
ncbi:hypothetical protein ABTW95_14785 [Spirillospora sp. NPDC127506]